MTDSFLKGPLAGKLFRFALPVAFTIICEQLVNATDVLILGKFVGADAMAAVGNDMPVISLLISLLVGLPLGSNVLLAQAIGGGNKAAARKILHTSLLFSVLIGGAFTLVGESITKAASQTDKRIKAVATLSMFNSGRVRRNGFQDKQIGTIQQRLAEASEARNEELKGHVEYVGFLPPHKDDAELRKIMEAQPEGLYKDGIDYYGLSYRSSRATGSYTKESFLKLMTFDVEDHMDLINQPLLTVAGSAADTLYMTEDAFKKATNAKDKELYLIPGASHIKTYWQPDYVKQELAKFEEFFGKNL